MNPKVLTLTSRISIMVSLLIAGIVSAWLGRMDNASAIVMERLMVCVLTGVAYKLYSAVLCDRAIRHLMVALSMWSCYEAVLGLLQNYGLVRSHHLLYQITGSFINPNPYAGFLAVSISVLVSYLVYGREDNRFVRALIYVALTLTAVILPATKCRAAFCALLLACTMLMWRNRKCREFLIAKAKLFLPLAALILVLLYVWKKPSADWRLFQNKMSVMAMLRNPLVGSGLGHYGGAASETQMDYFRERIDLNAGEVVIPDALSRECRTAGRSLYAFCDPLQIGVEAGAVTMVVYLLLVGMCLVQLYRMKSHLFYGAAALQVISLVSYPLQVWQTELLFAIMIAESCRSDRDGRSVLLNLPLALVAGCLLWYCHPICKSIRHNERLWRSDRFFYDRKEYGLYAGYCSDKLTALDRNEDFMTEYGVSLAEIGQVEFSDSVLTVGFEAIGSPAFLIQLGNNRMAVTDYDAAEIYYWNAFCLIPDRVFPLRCLAMVYQQRGRVDCLERIQQFVEGFHPRVESGTTERLRREILMLE